MTNSNTDLDQIDWSLIDESKARFILDQAEKAMNAAKENNNILDSKIAHLITVYISILALIVASIPFIPKDNVEKSYLGLILIFILGILIALFLLFLGYRAQKIPIIGTSPSELLKKKYNKSDLKFLINSQSRVYSKSLTGIKENNEKTGKFVNWSLIAVIATLFISFLYLLLPAVWVALLPLLCQSCCLS